MSFGRWHEEQQAAESGAGGTSNSWFGDLTMSSEQLLPLYEGMQPVNLQSIRSSMEAQMPQKIMGMGYQQRFKVFSALLLLSALFFALAFGFALPMITIRPQKFAISFTMGSLLFMGSFGILKGPAAHMKSMCSGDRMLFTTVYITSMLATLYFTFTVGGPKGYIYVMVASGGQILALLYYLVSFLPGGAAGLRILIAAMCRLLQPIMLACAKVQAICMARCCKFWVQRSFGGSSEPAADAGPG